MIQESVPHVQAKLGGKVGPLRQSVLQRPPPSEGCPRNKAVTDDPGGSTRYFGCNGCFTVLNVTTRGLVRPRHMRQTSQRQILPLISAVCRDRTTPVAGRDGAANAQFLFWRVRPPDLWTKRRHKSRRGIEKGDPCLGRHATGARPGTSPRSLPGLDEPSVKLVSSSLDDRADLPTSGPGWTEGSSVLSPNHTIAGSRLWARRRRSALSDPD